MSKSANLDYTVRKEGSIEVRHEHDKYGNPTGCAYYHCPFCGGECMTDWPKENLTHKPGCPLRGEE